MRAFRQYYEQIKEAEEQTGAPHDKHHRRMKCHGGGMKRENISIVKREDHVHFHAMFGSMTPQEIAEHINRIWIPKEYMFVCVPTGSQVVVVAK